MNADDAGAVRTVAQDLILGAVWEKVVASAAGARCAACVWLISLLTYCHRHARLVPLLLRSQEAFAQLLGDTNELTQVRATPLNPGYSHDYLASISFDVLFVVFVGLFCGFAQLLCP